MLRILLTALIASTALADNVTIGGATGVTVQGNGCGIASSQTSVSLACGSAQLSYSITPGPIFDSFSAAGQTSTVDFTGPGAGDNLATSIFDVSETETLNVAGGSGQGVLVLSFLLTGNGFYGGDNSESTAGEILSFPGPQGDNCTGSYGVYTGIYNCGLGGLTVYDRVNFTFGTPFEASLRFDSRSGSADAGASSFTATSTFESFMVLQNGVAVPGATLIGDAPEPSELLPLALLVCLSVCSSSWCRPASQDPESGSSSSRPRIHRKSSGTV